MPIGPKILIYSGLLALALAISAIARMWARRERPLPYFSRETLLTSTELAFWRTFRAAVPAGVGVSMKVRLADVINCSAASFKEGHFAKIQAKHLDFVLYDAATTAILAGVELDDRSHRRADRVARDLFLDRAMAAAGVPLIRVPAAKAYDVRELRRAIGEALGPVSLRN